MKRDLKNIRNNFLFSSQLRFLVFSEPGVPGYYKIKVIGTSSKTVLFEITLRRMRASVELPLPDISDPVNNFLDQRGIANRITVQVTDPSGQVFDYDFSCLRRTGKDDTEATEYVNKYFLADLKGWLIPRDGLEVYSPTISAYSHDSEEELHQSWVMDGEKYVYRTKYSTMSGGAILNYQTVLQSRFDSVNEFMLKLGDRQMPVKIIPSREGVAFVFRNSFNVVEYAFFPGVVTSKITKDSREIDVHGITRQADNHTFEEFTLKVSNAPDWLVQNAYALLEARAVEIADDPIKPGAIGKNTPVIVTEISSTATKDPSELSDITITYKNSKL